MSGARPLAPASVTKPRRELLESMYMIVEVLVDRHPHFVADFRLVMVWRSISGNRCGQALLAMSLPTHWSRSEIASSFLRGGTRRREHRWRPFSWPMSAQVPGRLRRVAQDHEAQPAVRPTGGPGRAGHQRSGHLNEPCNGRGDPEPIARGPGDDPKGNDPDVDAGRGRLLRRTTGAPSEESPARDHLRGALDLQ